ncbi:MAG: InlB B-repeat-containing protein [Bacilli bacterium]|jgi:uncharacterized repeat protein (TIGR02543 family)
MKKASTKLLRVLIVCFLLLLMSGCRYRYDPYKDKVNVVVETDYFYVQLIVKNVKEPRACILELTDLGKEQEILVIPEYVEGLPVRTIGRQEFSTFGWRIISDNLKKVYVPITVTSILSTAFLDCTNLEELVMLSVPINYNMPDLWSTGGQATIILSNPLQENRLIAVLKPENITLPVNLVFYYNYSDAPNSGYYWFDYITGSNLYVLPNNPEREGYTFKGWYIDEECSIEWDKVLPTSETEILELYALWE